MKAGDFPALVSATFIVLAGVIAAPPVAVANETAPALDKVAVEAGKRLYRGHCQKCHGFNMVSSGGGFFDLRKFPLDDKSRFLHSVIEGKRAMPAWGNILNAEEIDQLWAYVASRGAPVQ